MATAQLVLVYLMLCLQGAISNAAETEVHYTLESMVNYSNCLMSQEGEGACTVAMKYGADVTDADGKVVSWNEFQQHLGDPKFKWPAGVSAKIPHVLVNNTSSEDVMIQSYNSTGMVCHTLQSGQSHVFPLASSGVTAFDAVIDLGGVYWIRDASANCSELCMHCFWWWTDSDRPQGAFLAQVGYGPGVPMMFGLFDGETNETDSIPKGYGGISGLELQARKWGMGEIKDGLQGHLDWDGGWDGGYGEVAVGEEVVTKNCSVGARWCYTMAKPYLVAHVAILGMPMDAAPELRHQAEQKYEHGDVGMWQQGGATLLAPASGRVWAAVAVFAGAVVAVVIGRRRALANAPEERDLRADSSEHACLLNEA